MQDYTQNFKFHDECTPKIASHNIAEAISPFMPIIQCFELGQMCCVGIQEFSQSVKFAKLSQFIETIILFSASFLVYANVCY